MTINWITIMTKDFEKSKEFYGTYLGLKSGEEFSPAPGTDIAFFEASNGMKIELISSQDSTSNTGVSIGIRSDKYSELLNEARSREILTAEPAVLGGDMECFFVGDPNGVGIQIIKG